MDRKIRVRLMKELIELYKQQEPYTVKRSDELIIRALWSLELVDKNAFTELEYDSPKANIEYLCKYPLTLAGENYIKWYTGLKTSSAYNFFIKDVLGYFGGIVAVFFLGYKLIDWLFAVSK